MYVMPANAGIRHTVWENGIQVMGWTPVFTGVTKPPGFRIPPE
jgi:hypothetical protein